MKRLKTISIAQSAGVPSALQGRAASSNRGVQVSPVLVNNGQEEGKSGKGESDAATAVMGCSVILSWQQKEIKLTEPCDLVLLKRCHSALLK